MKFIRAGARTGTFALGGIRLASVLEKSEEELAKLEKELKSSRSFRLLRAAGVVRSSGFKGMAFGSRNFKECRLKSDSGPDLSPLLNAKSEFIGRIEAIGRKNFEEYFLKGGASDTEISEECGLTFEEIKKMKEFVDDFFIYSDLQGASAVPKAAPVKVYSAVAGVEIKNGRPELSFFRREVWKERFSVDKDKLSEYLEMLSKEDYGEARKTLESLNLVESRKSTLYSLLELLLKEQKEYFLKGTPEDRKPLRQKEAAGKLGVHPSVLNRIVSNKSLEMPWGVEIPLSELLPSDKAINRERLWTLMNDYPDLPDRELAEKMSRIYGATLSRRSVAQYRKELLGKDKKKRR